MQMQGMALRMTDDSNRTRTVLELPWPPKELSPNARVHWAKKTRITKAYRTTCAIVGFAHSLRAAITNPVDDIPLHMDFYPIDKRRRDLDNLIASMKAAQDGLADSMSIDDALFITTYRLHPNLTGERGGFVRVTMEL